MPGMWGSTLRRGPKPWRMMERWERKRWHREEAIRLGNGLKPRSKP